MYKWTLTSIKRENRTSGFHFFEPATLRFFWSRNERGVYQGPDGVYFVTSEQFPGDEHLGIQSWERLYTVRRFFPEDGNVRTEGEFQGYQTAADARRAARELANGGGNE